MSKIEQILKLAGEFKLGSVFKLRGFDAEITAYSDEHVFFTVPEAAVDPDELDLTSKRVRDLEVENLKRDNYQLREEIKRLIADERYRHERLKRDDYERQMMRDSYNAYDYMRYPSRMKRPILTEGITSPGEAPWIDPLAWKDPTQKKR